MILHKKRLIWSRALKEFIVYYMGWGDTKIGERNNIVKNQIYISENDWLSA